jgi:hypothetical protein
MPRREHREHPIAIGCSCPASDGCGNVRAESRSLQPFSIAPSGILVAMPPQGDGDTHAILFRSRRVLAPRRMGRRADTRTPDPPATAPTCSDSATRSTSSHPNIGRASTSTWPAPCALSCSAARPRLLRVGPARLRSLRRPGRGGRGRDARAGAGPGTRARVCHQEPGHVRSGPGSVGRHHSGLVAQSW